METLRSQASILRELLIVIVGVAIALAAESWWSGRVDSRREVDYVEALRVDFHENVDSLRSSISLHRDIQQATSLLMSVSAGQAQRPPVDSLRALAWLGFSTAVFSPITTTYDNLVATGDLKLVSDGDLRRLLARFDAQLGKKELDWQWDQWMMVVQPYVNQHMEALDWPPSSWSDDIALPDAPTRTDWTEVLEDREFRNVLFNRFIASGDARTYYLEPLLELAEQILARLDRNIEG